MFANAKNLHFDAHQLGERDTLSHATSIIVTNKTTLGGTTTRCSTEDKINPRQLISHTDCASCRIPDVSNFLFIIIKKAAEISRQHHVVLSRVSEVPALTYFCVFQHLHLSANNNKTLLQQNCLSFTSNYLLKKQQHSASISTVNIQCKNAAHHSLTEHDSMSQCPLLNKP
jgi:hypothetical protein